MNVSRLLVAVLLVAAGKANCDEAQDILRATGVQGGLVIHVGCGDGRLTAALGLNESYLVQGLDRDPGNVDKARTVARATSNRSSTACAP